MLIGAIVDGAIRDADKHGFPAVPLEDEAERLEAARFMDSQECRTMIAAARETTGLATDEMLR